MVGLGTLPSHIDYETNYKMSIRTYHAPTIKPMRNPTLQALLFNTAKIPRKRTKLTSERSMYAAGNVNPHPNPLRILPTIIGVKLNCPAMMQIQPASSDIMPSLKVQRHPIFSMTDPLNSVPIIIVKESTLTARTNV